MAVHSDRVLLSTGGEQWRDLALPDGTSLDRLTYTGTEFAGVSHQDGQSVVPRSVDGENWTTSGSLGLAFDLFYGVGRYAALSSAVVILSSPDRIEREAYRPNWKVLLNAGTCSQNLCVAVGESGQILTSPDLISWTPRVVVEPDQFAGVAFDGTQFVATSAWYSLTSPDGIDWTSHKVWEYWRMHRVTYKDGRFITIGSNRRNATLMTSAGGSLGRASMSRRA